MSEHHSDTKRLEELWAGGFGNAYIERNRAVQNGRQPFWQMILAQCPVQNVLEVGCNVGPNLTWLAQELGPERVFGVDVNVQALAEVRRTLPEVNAVYAPARELPFRDRLFDLVFTTGVLIHQSPGVLPIVMAEIVRCSRKYVLCGEYFAEELTEVPYRGQTGALWKRDFGGLYLELFPELKLVKQGFLPKSSTAWDDVTYWVLEKQG